MAASGRLAGWVRRASVATLALIGGAILVAGALRPDGSVAPEPGVVTIRYWEKWTGVQGEAMQAAVDEFNGTVGKAKGIRVELVSMSQIDQKTLISTAAGVPPDIAGLWDTQLAQFAAMDAIEPLDALAAEHGITADRYKPAYWKVVHYDNKLYGLVSTGSVIALHYNTQLFA